MHLLNARPGSMDDDSVIFRIEQTPADIILLSSADTELALLAEAAADLPESSTSLRVASLLPLRNHASVDLYLDEVLRHARLIVVSLLGGEPYWSYGVQQCQQLARQQQIPLLFVPGDDRPDPELQSRSTVAPEQAHTIWRYLREGGLTNATQLLLYLNQQFFDLDISVRPPEPLPRLSLYLPGHTHPDLGQCQARWQDDQAVVWILFYRAHWQSGNTLVFDALLDELHASGLNPLAISISSLKDEACIEWLRSLHEHNPVRVILNTTGFALSRFDQAQDSPLPFDVPVLQVVLSGGNADDWKEDTQGLSPRDLAMNVALPEVDGRIISRAISFKGLVGREERSQHDVVRYIPEPERIQWLAQLSQRWSNLASKPNSDKRIALILANYPTREGRLGNGVGLDTPASTINVLNHLQAEGYRLHDIPNDGTALMQKLQAYVTNDPHTRDLRGCMQSVSLENYQAWFNTLPIDNQAQVLQRWGESKEDAMVRQGRIMVPGIRLGHIFVGIQPARGYHLDLKATYHDPDLVPPHAYLAFYAWVRHEFMSDAIIHMGKHGNLEWLPGKNVALGPTCWPDLILGPVPHLYPFIVNDPGEGTQAKRRTQAVIIDHLIPPMTRAETYGPLRDLEVLVDEYYEAQSTDPRRTKLLHEQIMTMIQEQSLHRDLGLDDSESLKQTNDNVLQEIDAYLCELKESQIRDGLHVFGESPKHQHLHDTLSALLRLPRNQGEAEDASLIRALALDLGLPNDFDPLECDMGARWTGPKPERLIHVSQQAWRTHGDTRERLELLALELIADNSQTPGPRTQLILESAKPELLSKLLKSGPNETKAISHGLKAGFVSPGPSGAPTRGRPDVLPTGRNFYSVDLRAIPSPTAWQLGFRSAQQLLERHLQDHGEDLTHLGLSVWGTATMRTGGDDIAQALALLGVKPKWAQGSMRVIDFEVLPVSLLDRPRVDVTLRVSGFFRDAFRNVIDFFDAAVQAVAELDERPEDNPVRARIQHTQAQLIKEGLAADEARQQAGWRIFGSKPGSYGAGLQGLIDERCWSDEQDLAEAYLNWGGYAYGRHNAGTPARSAFVRQLSTVQAVLQNQDNREHDLLDSDDYYQFQGGMHVAAKSLQGHSPKVYHADHSLPEAPKIRSLAEELSRVIRARVLNPKWIKGVMRHGYKGAFEMAATVDYLFAYDATTGLIRDDQYAQITAAYVLNPEVRQFFMDHNPMALQELSERLLEAQQRGLWQDGQSHTQHLEQAILDVEHSQE